MKRVTVGMIVGILVIGVGILALGGGSNPPASSALEPVPDLAFTYFDGSQGAFSDFEGTPLVVNFWASWCPACIAEMPGFQAAFEQFDGRVAFLGVDVQDTREDALRLVGETGVGYLLADDPDGTVFSAFGGIAMPTTVFIDADGGVVETFSGVLTEDLLTERIETLLLHG